MRMLVFLAVAAIGFAGVSLAGEGSTSVDVPLRDGGWIDGDRQDGVLLIETTDSALDEALNTLGVPFDNFEGADFSGLDLSPYEHVFVAMDGGTVEAPSIQNLANFVNAGGCLHIYGGTCYQPYAIALNDYLLENNTADYCWSQVAGSPDSEVVDAGHYLADGLPATYNFVDPAATYYSTRSTDAATAVAAVNGDGYDHLLSKEIGEGNFDICINSPYASYYLNQTDMDWLTKVVENMLVCGGEPTATEGATWGQIKARYGN